MINIPTSKAKANNGQLIDTEFSILFQVFVPIWFESKTIRILAFVVEHGPEKTAITESTTTADKIRRKQVKIKLTKHWAGW